MESFARIARGKINGQSCVPRQIEAAILPVFKDGNFGNLVVCSFEKRVLEFFGKFGSEYLRKL